MSDDGNAKPRPIERLPNVENDISALASAHAPILFFDSVPARAYLEGVGSINVTCLRTLPRRR